MLPEAKCPQAFSYMEKIKKKLIFMWDRDATEPELNLFFLQ